MNASIHRLGLACALSALVGPSAAFAETLDRLPGFERAPRTEEGRFMNPSGLLTHGSFGVRFPFFLRRAAGIFRTREGAPERVAFDADSLAAFEGDAPAVTWVGHSTLLVRLAGSTFLTDPAWTDTPSPVSFAGPRRFVEPGISLDSLPPVDFVIISHDHFDHLDLFSLRELRKRNPDLRLYVPLGIGDLLEESGIPGALELDWGDIARHQELAIHCVPAQHWARRGLGDENLRLWASWAIVSESHRFYFAGDTGSFPGFLKIGARLGPFDLAALPIGAYEPVRMMRESHLDPEKAVQAALDLRARRALAIHFGTFDLSDEPLDEPPRRFLAEAKERGLTSAWTLRIGETRGF